MPAVCVLHPVASAFRTALLVLALTALGGCGQDASAPAGPRLPPLASTTTATSPAATAPDDNATGNEEKHGEGYNLKIVYPTLEPEWKVLDQALRVFASARKKQFLDDAAKRSQPLSGSDALWELNLEFNLQTQTSEFVSVLATGSVYTGGAHALPMVASFTLHLPSSKLIGIRDLFADADAALKVISEETRRQLNAQFDSVLRQEPGDPKTLAEQLKNVHGMIVSGTQPTAENFAVFLVDGVGGQAIGLTMIFPPYQVAPYVYGDPQVEVPAKLFYGALKAEYRSGFAIDTEDLKRLQASGTQ